MMSPSPAGLASPVRRLLRRQRRSAGPTALIVLTLALALGANTAMFSIADALLVRAVPFKDAERLVAVTIAFPSIKLTGMNLSGPEALELSALTQAFSALGAYQFTGLVVQGGTEAELASGTRMSRGAFEALQLTPLAGRPFEGHEYREGGPNVAMLGYGLWHRAFGADPNVIGRVVQLGGTSYEVVGVLPDGLSLLNQPMDVLLPLTLAQGAAGSRSDHGYNVIARIADGRSFADAVADVNRAMGIWRDETGEMHVPSTRMHPLSLTPFTQATTGLHREPIGALLAAVLFVLLIACANISNLLVARAERQRADLAVQLALGATRQRLLADSILEGLVLAVTGSVGGLLVSHLLVGFLRTTWPAMANVNLSLDYRILGITGALAGVTGLLIGVAPILRLDVKRASEWLRSGARGSIGAAGGMRLQRLLIALQVALAVLLSASAGLLVRSLLAMTSVDTGIQAEGVLRAQISLPAGGYPEDSQVWSFYDGVMSTLRAAPGVAQVSVVSGLPPIRRANNTSFLLDGNETMNHTNIHQVEFVQHVSPEYLRTLGITVRDGRPLAASDDERAAPVALVNETLARRFWPGESAIGHRLKPAGNIGTWFTVVGVVSDVRQNGLQSPPEGEIYVPYRQARLLMSTFMPRTMNLLVRTSGEPLAVAGAVRNAVRTVDPAAAVSGLMPMQAVVDRTIAQPRLLAWMFGAFALLALVIAGIGVYAVTSYAVGTRTAEFGVRLALGGRPQDILRLVMLDGLPTVVVGVTAGAAAAAAAGRLLRNLLFAVEPLDPGSLAAAAAVMAITALTATILPATRAAGVDPLTALRD